ncbi:TonB-dependent siderophore receptor [Methylobacterium sp. 092160098-2]|uniref:TonB-dependent siderophore receptor n=1 Tax=Methylobacterium sp. 092160098-2 TaxID=3025129 RepID=UPI0023819A6E|nr:TonB-dependent siderophore receptor [Methylobacterium sp. 092160098-2]MDE4915168.1 TonB-dependent siderophore receptor [Methylobacterium sp. 092160098-2]
MRLFTPRPSALRGLLAGASLAILTQATLIAVGPALAQDATPPRPRANNPVNQTAQSSVQLEELSVTGQGGAGPVAVGPVSEDPRGPITGFVAKRSLTATKTDTPLIETPQSITVIGRQQLDTQKAQSVSEALQYAPGVFGSPFGPDPRLDFFLIRGFTTSDTGLYRDGLQLLNFGFGSFKVEQFGLERIDILRGPAAVLFGQGSPGGVVNLETKHPTLQPFGYIEAGGGSFGQKYLAFDIGGPADADGHLFYRLTAIGRNGGTQVDGVEDNVGYIAPAFTWKPDGSTTFTILSSFQHDENGRINAFLPYYGTVRPQAEGLRIPRSYNTQDDIQNRFRRTQAMIGYEFEHVFDEVWTVRQNARLAFAQTYDNSLSGGLGYVDPLGQTQLSRYRFQATSTQRLFNVDTQAVARFNDGLFGHTFLMGIDYKYFSLNDNQGTFFGVDPFNLAAPNFVSPTGAVSPYLVNFDVFQQTGIYVQDQIKLTPELTLIASGRGDFTTNEVNDKLASPVARTTQNANAATERFALIYNFDFGLAPYVSYATSFNPQVGTNVFGQPFKPTTGEQYEAGVKYQPPGVDLLFAAAFFDLALNNSLSVDPNNPNNSLQLGLTRSRGAEASVTANITPNFNVIASVTNYELKIERGDNVGRTPAGVPQSFASVFGDYTIPTGEFAGFGFGGGVRYVGHSYATTDNSLKVPERVLFDTLVHYTSGKWRFAINAANIFDKRFVSSCTSINACFYGEARRVTASLSYKW